MVVTVVLILLIQIIVIPGIPVWVSNIDQEVVDGIVGGSELYDTRDEIEAAIGAPFETDESGKSTYHIKISGDNYELVVVYGLDGKVQGKPTNTPKK